MPYASIIAMTLKEKSPYQQIHPAKLTTDWGASFIAFYLMWQHALLPALTILLVPPIIATAVVVRYANLDKLKNSPFGRYIAHYMTGATQAIRLAGAVIMAVGAWYHLLWLLILGLLVILFGWLRGLILPNPKSV